MKQISQSGAFSFNLVRYFRTNSAANCKSPDLLNVKCLNDALISYDKMTRMRLIIVLLLMLIVRRDCWIKHKMVQQNVVPNVVTYNALMDGYCLQGRVDEARNVLDSMASKSIAPDTHSYTILIHRYCKNMKIDDAINLFHEMLHKGLKPDVVTYTSLLHGLFRSGRCSAAVDLFKELQVVGLKSNFYPYCNLLNEMCKNGYVERASLVLDAIRAALQATARPIKRKKEGEEKRMTQEEMLLEAAQTDNELEKSGEGVSKRRRSEKRAIVHKAVYSGPQIQYLSKNGDSYLTFLNGSSFESEVSTSSVPYPEKAVCAVTGLPATYRDPKTGLPYATKEAFKIIRERFAQETNCSKKESRMGLLSDPNYEQGFSRKRKRSVIRHNKETPSYSRHFTRFRIIPPTLEIEDSD